jgi:hypothetical protein
MSSCKGIAEFSKRGIKWVRNDKVLPEDNLYIRWGCTTNVPSKNVLNTAAAIHEVNDKSTFRHELDKQDLCPATWLNQEEVPDAVLRSGVIVRPVRHAQGRHLYLCKTKEELEQAVRACGEGYYIGEYIKKVAEYRVAVVQGRAVWVAKKTPADPAAIAWNVAKGGRFDNVRWNDWPLKVVKTAIEGFNLSSLDFGGVDVMVDQHGECFILEINSAPSLTSPYRQECFAKAFDYILDFGKERIPLIQEKGGYLKFIHPALTEKAKLQEAA